MKTLATVSAVTALLAAGLLSAAPAQAQSARTEVVPMAGVMIFDDLLRGPLGSTLSNANGRVFGAQVSVPLAGPVSVYGSGAFARSDLTVGLPILGGVTVGRTDAWLFDGGLQIRATTPSGFAPFAQVGGGASRYRISNAIIDTESTNPVLTLGAGIDVPLFSHVGLRLMARDYIGKFDFQEAVYANIEGRTAHHVGLIAGLRIGM
jgi:hypothetical protein